MRLTAKAKRIAHGRLNPKLLKEFDALLDKLSDSTEARAEARRELIAAVDAYRAHPQPEVAKTRQALSKLHSALNRAMDRATELPYQAHLLFSREFGPLGKLQATLRPAAAAAKRATLIANSKDLPNRQPDYGRTLLAYDVARILRDRLSIPPRLARDDLQKNDEAPRGGAAYARLLRKVFALAKISTVEDLWPDMHSGIQLLRDPRGDNPRK
jgi:hypothetical protein